ncbi:hypothetical protein GCM10011571_30360 [Marinithermofilum abyssi]|uniref:EDD domain protein, DegV family n=1 Tax=Marinithermofilum abyssi TaxID=1571185 RepID=A0A8J2VJM6_9BACL|nr:DegV family protein [Marinithermofilum abyssi]GGE26145.1 hypothetical protein GCM10011571_30360 [Marinithermofilum abyssi]
MNKIALVTDSSCDLPVDMLKKFDIEVIPLRLIYKEGEYRDGVDITPQQVYDRLEEEVPTTSMPSPEDIHAAFQRLEEQGYTHCIVLALSSGLNGTFNTFKVISQDFEKMKIDVIDSKGLSWVLGFLVIEAAQLIKKNIPYRTS